MALETTGATRVRARAAASTGAKVMSYALVEGIRSEVDGLAAWLRRSSVRYESETNDEGRIQKVTVSAASQPPVVAVHSLNLALTPHFVTRGRQQGSERTVVDQALVRTRADGLRPWSDHLDAHRRLQELVSRLLVAVLDRGRRRDALG
jgi:hypothetical protein